MYWPAVRAAASESRLTKQSMKTNTLQCHFFIGKPSADSLESCVQSKTRRTVQQLDAEEEDRQG